MAKKPNKLFTLLSIFHTIVLISTQISAQKSPIFACDTKTNPNFAHYKFCDSSARVAERVDDLVKRLSLDEKVGFLVNKAKGVESLGIPNYEWWGEALHGVAYSPSVVFGEVVPGATSFPQVVLTAASFNVTLFEAIGKAVSTEARAMHNVGLAGLTFWAPNVNIFRDPRWGRGQETPGEDPYLTSVYVSAYVRGLQQREDGDKDRLKIAACCKHYTAYDLESWKGIDRHHFNAVVTKQDLEDTYQPPFKSCVIEGNVASVMCSFNQVNGKPTCGDENLLKGVVRGEWKLNGYIVTDCDSIQVFHDDQHYGKTPEDAVAKALLAGVDLNCGDFYKNFTVKAVKTGLVNESVVDKALTNNLATLMRLGFFDGDPRDQCYGNLGPNDVCTKEHRELAREAARQGIVLLKNDAKTLPFSLDTIKSLAIIGPNANATGTMLGNYNGQPCEYISPLDGLSALPLTIYYTPGCDILCEEVEIEISTQIAAMADATILVVGDNTHDIQGEGRDRVDLTLPGMQENLIYRVALASKGPVILVVMSSGGLDVEFAKYDDIISSILWVGYPGQAGGAALADVIFGFYNPSGLLPTSWYPQSYAENVPMTNMNMRPDPKNGYPGRTYRFYTGPTVYKFGDGLSYSNFSVSFDEAPELVMIPLKENHICRFKKCKTINVDKQSCEPFKFPLKVKNEGPMSGSYTVLLIIDFPPVPKAPKEHLARFEKVFLEPNTETKVVFEIDRCEDLSVVDEFGNWKIVLGEHLVKVGNVMHYLNVRV